MWTYPNAIAKQAPLFPALADRPKQRFPENADIFSRAWNAMRFPGMRHRIPTSHTTVPGLYPATVALCRALLTRGHSLWIDQPERSDLHQWCRYGTEGRLVNSPETADFTLVTQPSRMPALYHLNIGDGSDPATATTLLVQVAAIDAGRKVLWRTKAAEPSRQASIKGLPQGFWRQREELQEMLPWGIDIFFIQGHSFVALPRSVRINAAMAV